MKTPNLARNQGGFTLIELMIVVGIVAVLAMVAVPAYKDYTIRAKMSEVVGFMAADKSSISEYYQTQSGWPASISEAGIDSGSRGGYITATALDTSSSPPQLKYTLGGTGTGLDGKDILLIPSLGTDGTISWDCKPGSVAAADLKYLPAECRV